MFEPAHYVLSPYAIPTFLTATLVWLVGGAVFIRERRTRISLSFFLTAASIGWWQLAFSFMYCATDPAVALWWAKAAYVAVPCIPTAIYHFTVRVLRLVGRCERTLRISWLLSLFFVAAILSTDALIAELYHHWWGYYPKYGWLSVPYLTFFFGSMIASLRHYWRAYHQAIPHTAYHRRARSLLMAFGIVYLGSFDYVAKFGVALYPFGYLPILLFLLLAARIIFRYRLVDVTPSLTMRPILDRMEEALLLLDRDGLVQVANRAACELFGLAEPTLRGRQAGALLSHPLFADSLERLLRGETSPRHLDVVYLRAPGDVRTFEIALSLVRDQTQQPAAVLCFVRDVTALREATATLAHAPVAGVEAQSANAQAQHRLRKPRAEATPSRFVRPRWQMVMTWAVLVCVSVGALVWVEATAIRRSLLRSAVQQNTTTARVVAQAVQEHFDGLARYVESFASRPMVIEATAVHDTDSIRENLEELVTGNAKFDRALVVDPAGRLWVEHPEDPSMVGQDLSHREWYRLVSSQQQTILSPIYQRAAWRQPSLVSLATPIRDADHRTIGYLMGQHTIERLAAWLLHVKPPGGGDVLLVDPAGTVAMTRAAEQPALATLPETSSMAAALRGQEGWLQTDDPLTGEPSLISYAPVLHTGWTVLARQPLAAVVAVVPTIQRALIVLAAVCGLVLTIGGWWWLQRMRRESRALLALTRAKEQYVTELQVTLEERKRVEALLRQSRELLELEVQKRTAELTKTVALLKTALAERREAEAALQRAHDELEHRVRERTAELAAANEALRIGGEKFRAVVETARDAIISADSAGKIVSWNNGAEGLFGYTVAEALGQPLTRLMPERFRQAHQYGLERMQHGGPSRVIGRTIELAGLRKDGTEFPLELSLSSWHTHDGTFFTAIIRDITERKRAEQERIRLASFPEENPNPVIEVSVEAGAITYLNPVAQTIFPDLSTLGLRHPALHDLPALEADLSVHRDSCVEREIAIGPQIYQQLISTVPGNNLLRIYMNDITKRKALEQQVLQAQKFELIGQLAAGIAHEINTPIQYVGSNTSFLKTIFANLERLLAAYDRLLDAAQHGTVTQDQLASIDALSTQIKLAYLRREIPKAIEQTLEGVQRAAKIVRSIKDMSHPDTGRKSNMDLNKVLENAITLSRNEWKYVAQMRVELDPTLPELPGIEDELHHALVNLLLNAAQAIAEVVGDGSGEKGAITVTSRRNGAWAEVRIADTGCGIPESIRPKIFQPFVTTKPVGKGTGQGLAIAHAVIVDKHQGSIDVETEEGKGTTFIIRLPLAEAAERSRARGGGMSDGTSRVARG